MPGQHRKSDHAIGVTPKGKGSHTHKDKGGSVRHTGSSAKYDHKK